MLIVPPPQFQQQLAGFRDNEEDLHQALGQAERGRGEAETRLAVYEGILNTVYAARFFGSHPKSDSRGFKRSPHVTQC